MEDNNKYGTLLNPSIKLHRQYFREAVKLLGIRVLYRPLIPGHKWTTYTEIDANYAPPILTGCLFYDHPEQATLKKIGWVAELQTEASVIAVDYDLPDLEVGALFIIPTGLDTDTTSGKWGRLFRVTSLKTTMVYPASIMCEIVPEYEDTFIPESGFDYTSSSFNLIDEEDERVFK